VVVVVVLVVVGIDTVRSNQNGSQWVVNVDTRSSLPAKVEVEECQELRSQGGGRATRGGVDNDPFTGRHSVDEDDDDNNKPLDIRCYSASRGSDIRDEEKQEGPK
jgi:hypothetical protein